MEQDEKMDCPVEETKNEEVVVYAEPIRAVSAESPEVVSVGVTEVAPRAEFDLNRNKKPANKKLGLIIGSAAAVLVIAFIFIFIFVIQPVLTYNKAEQAFADGDLNEAERLLEKIPEYKDTPELTTRIIFERAEIYFDKGKYDEAEAQLLTIPQYSETQDLLDDITYERAVQAIEEKDYETAQRYLDSIPHHDDPENLKQNICYNQALEILETGDYVTAYNMLKSIADYEDSAELADILYNEAMALTCILDYRQMLKDPSSLQIYTLEFFDESEDLPTVYMEAGAKNGFGAMLTSYVLYANNMEYLGSVTDLYPKLYSWSDTDDYLDYLVATVMVEYTNSNEGYGNFDLNRINRLLTAGVTFNIDFDFSAGTVNS